MDPTIDHDAFHYSSLYLLILGSTWLLAQTLSINLLKLAHRRSQTSLSSSHLLLLTTFPSTETTKMQWSPYDVLKIEDISTCVGYAHSQGRRCGNRLSYEKIEGAQNLLNYMSTYALSMDAETHKDLETLAIYLLCSQRHRHQAESLTETWKRQILRLQRARVVQEIQGLKFTVEDITARLEASSLTVPHPALSHDSSRARARDENWAVQAQEHNAGHSNATSSSSRLRFTTIETNGLPPSNLLFGYDGNFSWHDNNRPDPFKGASPSDRRSTPPPSAEVRQAKNGNHQSLPHTEAKTGCPICLDKFESKKDESRCHGCLEKFHESCMREWLKQCEKTRVNTTCPCW